MIDSTLTTPYRRVLVQFWQFSSYTKAFCQANMRGLPAGCEIDHRLTALQLKVSFDLFLEFHLYLVSLSMAASWAISAQNTREFFGSKNQTMYAEGPLKSRDCTEEAASAFSCPFQPTPPLKNFSCFMIFFKRLYTLKCNRHAVV